MGFALSEMQVTSASFETGGAIAAKHTGEGEDVSPALAWSDAPEGTKSFAVICHDPDAPLVLPGRYGFVHWTLYNLSGTATGLEQGSGEGTQGANDFGNQGYNGPMPPEGHGVHHYFFWLLALDQDLGLEPGLNMWDLLTRIEPHVLGMNRLVGTYRRG